MESNKKKKAVAFVSVYITKEKKLGNNLRELMQE